MEFNVLFVLGVVLLILTPSSRGFSALQLSVGTSESFTIDFFPLSTLAPADCFHSECGGDDNFNFYLQELYVHSAQDPCDFADTLFEEIPESSKLFSIANNQLDFGVAAFFRMLYHSANCKEDFQGALSETNPLAKLSGLPTIRVNIIETPHLLDLSSWGCFDSTSGSTLPSCHNTSSLINVNFVVPSWCESTCGFEPEPEQECSGRDYEIPRQTLDWIIARFEVKRLIHRFAVYLQEVEEEMSILHDNWDNELVPWVPILNAHTEANECMLDGLTGESLPQQHHKGLNSLDWALTYIVNAIDNNSQQQQQIRKTTKI